MTRIVRWLTFMFAGFAPLLPAIQILPGISMLPYLDLLVFLPGTLVGGWHLLSQKYRLELLPIGVLCFLLLAGVTWTKPTEIGRALLLIASFGVTLSLSGLTSRREEWMHGAHIYLWSTAFSVVVLFTNWLNQGNPRFGALYNRVGTRILEPNVTAIHLGFACLLILTIAFSAEKRLWSLSGSAHLLLLPVFVGAFLLTGSRGAFFALIGSLLVMIFWIQGRTLNKFVLYSAYALVWSAVLLVVTPNPIRARLTLANVETVGDRLPIWTTGIEVVLSAERMLVLGAGTGGAAEAIAAYNPQLAISRVGDDGILRANAHSGYVEWLVSFGLVGIIVALVVSISLLARASRVDRGQPLAFGMSLIAFFFITSFSLIAYRLGPVSIACGALTLGYLYYQRDENNSPPRRRTINKLRLRGRRSRIVNRGAI